MKYIGILILAIGISCLLTGIVYNSIPKTAFVYNHQLFEKFEGRKELEHRLEQGANLRKATLDSLSLQIQQIQLVAQSDKALASRLRTLQQQYAQLNQEHQMTYQQQSLEYTESIWKQISQYTIEYGEEHGYDYVFGIAGQGSLMYGKVQYNITDDVIQYINSKYAGN